MAERHKHHVYVEADQEISLNIGDAGDGRWFKLFHAVVESGIWAKLTLAGAKVLIVLAKHANGDWIAWPSVPTIARLAGLKQAAAYKGIAELERLQLLVRRRGYRRAATYRLIEPIFHGGGIPPTWNSTPVESDSTSAESLPIPLNKTHEQQQGAAAVVGAGADLDQDVVEALILAEIAEPTRSQLAGLVGITAALVARVAQRTKDQGGGTGAVVQNIRTAVAASVKRRQRAAAKTQVESELAEQERRRREAEKTQVAVGEDRRRLIKQGLERLK